MTTVALRTARALIPSAAMRRGFLLGLLGSVVVGIFLLVGLSIGLALAYQGRVLPGVRVGGLDVTGLTGSQIEERLAGSLPSVTAGAATLVVDGSATTIGYGQLGRGYDTATMAAEAMAVARSGNIVVDAIDRLRSLIHPTEIAIVTHAADDAAIDAAVAAIVDSVDRLPVSAQVRLDASGSFAVTPAEPGRTLDPAQLRAALVAALADPNPDGATISLSTRTVAPTVGTAQAATAAEEANRMVAGPLSLAGGTLDTDLTVDQLRGIIGFELAGTRYHPVVDEAALSDLLEGLATGFTRDAVDAAFTWDATGVSGVVPAVTGRNLDPAGTVSAIERALDYRAGGSLVGTVPVAFIETQPSLTTAAATQAASQMVRISTWTTWYVPGESNYWGANISIPARDLDQMVIAPGEWFSFWDDIGPVTTARGYGYGGVIIGGKSEPTGALAGGICSTSTTLFNAAMRAGLQIGDRTNHSYYIERYPVGLDATVLKTDTSETNMTFRNDTPDPIIIRSYTGTGFVRFDIWGVPTGRTVSLSAPVITNQHSARDTTVVNASLKPGTSVRVEYPHNGFDASVTRVVRDADGNVLWQNTWVSHYRTVTGILEVGPEKKPKASPSPSPSAAPSA